ncbi:50S ribosomal protein L20 [Vitis vinifera]|uniref:Large ribosomal subunit protein bL20c n=1 Tax=Vitis vinifera TaxID=29760 RepID=A0A438J3U1_VITVI|nr:50S ribosomal protein L20 [Vitis vinifera]
MPSKVELTPLCECAVCIEKDRKMNKDKIFKLAKGFRGRAKNCIRIARERVEKALQYSYRDRRTKKRDMRSLWIERINAGSRLHGVCFSFLHTSFFLFNCSFELLLVVPCCSNAAAAANFMPQSHSSNAVNLLMTTLSGFWNVLQDSRFCSSCSAPWIMILDPVVNYNNFIHGLMKENIQLNRKVLSELSMHEPYTFKALVDISQNAFPGNKKAVLPPRKEGISVVL